MNRAPPCNFGRSTAEASRFSWRIRWILVSRAGDEFGCGEVAGGSVVDEEALSVTGLLPQRAVAGARRRAGRGFVRVVPQMPPRALRAGPRPAPPARLSCRYRVNASSTAVARSTSAVASASPANSRGVSSRGGLVPLSEQWSRLMVSPHSVIATILETTYSRMQLSSTFSHAHFPITYDRIDAWHPGKAQNVSPNPRQARVSFATSGRKGQVCLIQLKAAKDWPADQLLEEWFDLPAWELVRLTLRIWWILAV